MVSFLFVFCSERRRVKRLMMLFNLRVSGSVSRCVGTCPLVVHAMLVRRFTGGSLAGHCLALSEGHSVLPGICFCSIVQPLPPSHPVQPPLSLTYPQISPHSHLLLPPTLLPALPGPHRALPSSLVPDVCLLQPPCSLSPFSLPLGLR